MKHVCIFILFMLGTLPMQVTAENFLPGYIITTKLDTLRGTIDFKTDEANSKGCWFRENGTRDKHMFLPGKIAGYRFLENGKYYVSKSIEVEGHKSEVFLEYLVKGLMNVYFYQKSGQSYFFFEKEDGSLQMITQNKEEIVNGRLLKDNRYDGELRYYFNQNIPDEYKNTQIDFNQKAMIDIAKKYHRSHCQEGQECIVFENKKPDSKQMEVAYHVYAGVGLSEYSIGNYEIKQGARIKVGTSSMPMVGLGADMYYPRWSQALCLTAEVSFSRIDIPRRYLTKRFEGQFKAYLASPGVGLRYTFAKRKLRPVIDLAASLAFSVKSESMIWDHQIPSRIQEYEYPFGDMFVGARCGIGADWMLNKKHRVTFRMCYNTLITATNSSYAGSADIKSYQLRIGYAFE